MSTTSDTMSNTAKINPNSFSLSNTFKTLLDTYVGNPAATIAYRRPADLASYALALTTATALLPLTTAFTSAVIVSAITMVEGTLSYFQRPLQPHEPPPSTHSMKEHIKRFTMTSGAIAGLTAVGLSGLLMLQNYTNKESPLAQQAVDRIKNGKLLVNGGPLYSKDGDYFGTIQIVSRNEPWSNAWKETAFYKLGQGQIRSLFGTGPWKALMKPEPWQELWNKMPFQSTGRVVCTLPQEHKSWVSGRSYQSVDLTVPFGTKNTQGQLGPFHSITLTFPETKGPEKDKGKYVDLRSLQHRPQNPVMHCVGPRDPGCRPL